MYICIPAARQSTSVIKVSEHVHSERLKGFVSSILTDSLVTSSPIFLWLGTARLDT